MCHGDNTHHLTKNVTKEPNPLTELYSIIWRRGLFPNIRAIFGHFLIVISIVRRINWHNYRRFTSSVDNSFSILTRDESLLKLSNAVVGIK